MTAEPDLLPLPLTDGWEPGCPYPEWVNVLLTDYARANVAHTTAAKDAEVEGLRLRDMQLQDAVRLLERANISYSQQVAGLIGRAGNAEARAERLAEALREAREYVVTELNCEREAFKGYEHCSDVASIEADLAKIDALLREQENDDA